MKALIVHGCVGVGLFAGSLVGGLWLTGRLNHEGTANIPLLSSFFPAPAAPATGAAATEGGALPAPSGETADAAHQGQPGQAQDASTKGAQEPDAPRRSKIGKSIVVDEKPGSGHGVEPAAATGEQHGEPEPEPGEVPASGDAPPTFAPAGTSGAHAAEQDFVAIERSLATDRKSKYAPGGFFVFEGMPAGLSPEQINDAWQRVQGVLTDIERRKTVLDLREQELQELADDIGRRQREVGRERENLDLAGRQLDEKIAKFQEQVKLVRNDEVAALRRNAETLASFEPSKAAELVGEQWKTEKGQDEVLKTFEFMDKDAVNQIVQMLPNAEIQDVLKKRLRVSKEAVPSVGTKK